MYPRHIKKFLNKVSHGIEPELLGMSTIVWWQNLKLQIGIPENTKIFYKKFKACILCDMGLSDRLRESGLASMFYDVI